MPSLLEILKDPNYVNANEATKAAIFNKYAPLDPNFADANEATQYAIRQKFGVTGEPMPAEGAPNAPTTLRDIAVAGASGVVGGVKSLVDVFGADSAASQTLGTAQTNLQELYTPERQKEIEYYRKLQEESAKSGDTIGEVIGAIKGIKAAPLQGTVQALGSLIPNLATLFIPGMGQARALQISRSAINTAIGVAQGTGAVKGAIYEGVKQELIRNGIDPEVAAQKAAEAQEYLGENADQIIGGAALGYVAGKVGAEQLIAPKAGAVTGRVAAIGKEIGSEATQGGQEQVAGNIALQRQGFDVPTFRGVAGAATQEGILGGLGAGPISILSRRPSKAEVPDAKPVEDKDVPLLLEGKGAFVPVGLPDGSVAMTREDLARYEEEKFQRQYAAQPINEEGATEEPAAPVMPTDAGLNYATATQEIEMLKRQPRAPEIDDRIQELQQYKLETLNDRINAARLPVSPELQAIREQMERGDMTYEGQQKAIDQLLAEFYASPKGFKGIEKIALPKNEIDIEVADLTKEARSIAAEYKKLSSGNVTRSLQSDLRGLLSPDEVVSEIGTEKQFRYLAAPKGKTGTSIADLVGDGILDNYLPPDMRSESPTFDNQVSEEYVKDLLRNADFTPYDAKNDARILGEKLNELDARIKELTEPQKRLQEISQQDISEETQRLAEEAGYLASPQPEEVLPSLDEMEAENEAVSPSATTPDTAGAAGVPLVQAGAPVQTAAAEELEGQTPAQDDAGLKYQQAQPGEPGVAKDALDQVVNTITPTWKNAPEIETVQSVSDLPDYLQEQIAAEGVNPRGIFDPDTAKVYLVADNISSQAQAAITLAHEALGHYGLRVVLGKNFVPMMNEIYAKNNAVRRRADAYMADGMDKSTAVEEVLSEMAQEVYDTRVRPGDIRLSALQKVMNAVRQFLARLGVPMKSITNAEVLKLIANARKAVVSGEVRRGETYGGKAVYSAKERIERVARRISSKRPEMQKDAFSDVDSDFVEGLKKHFFPDNKTIVDRLDGMRDNFWKKLAQGVADQYRSIKDYTAEGYMLARMSKTIDGALEGILFNGHAFLNGGALDIKPNTKGLIQTMEPVGKEVDRFQIWMALNRDAQLVRQGKAPSVDPKLVARASELSKGKIGGQSRLEVYEKVRKDLNALNKSVLDIARKQGLIDEQAYQTFAADINYIPFYRAMEDGDVQGAATASGLTRQEFSKALKGGEKPFGDLMENTLRNWSHILSASMKNKAANVTVEAALDMGAAYPNLKAGLEWRDGKVYSSKSGDMVGDGKMKAEYTTQKAGMVKTMIDGKPAYFEIIDPLLLDAISSIGYMGPKSKFLDVAKDFKNLLQFGVTLSPAFKVRNLFRDSISAMAVSDLKKNPWSNVVNGWSASDRNNPAHISALAGGAIFNFGSYYEGDQSRLIKRLLESGVDPESILDSEQKIKAGLQYAWRKYQDWGNKSEAANRMALYNQMRERGMSHLEASFYARDLLDFSMQGSWPAFRILTQVVPFLNARVQGLYKLGRDGIVPTSRVIYNTVTGKPTELTDKQKAAQFSTVTGAVVLASMFLYLLNKDDEEFKKREAWDRDNFWWFRLPGMETALRVPKPFEIGAFGTMAERTLEQIVDQGAEGKQFEESFRRMLGDTFSLNPTPQAIKPLLDLYANKDSFTGAPIETAGMERLSKQERASDRTSPLAMALGGISNVMANITGEKTELSPVQIDYAIKSYLGWLGGTISTASHYAVMPFSKSAYPDQNWSETMSMGFVKSLPQTQSRYVTEFYQNAKDISQAYADMRHYAELGQSEKVQEIIAEKGDKIAMAKAYDKAAKDMSDIRKAISAIKNDETMSGAQKQDEIDRLKLIIGMIAEQMENARRSLRK